MHFYKQKIYMTLLAGVLALSMAACGEQTTSSSSTASTPTQTTGSATTTTAVQKATTVSTAAHTSAATKTTLKKVATTVKTTAKQDSLTTALNHYHAALKKSTDSRLINACLESTYISREDEMISETELNKLDPISDNTETHLLNLFASNTKNNKSFSSTLQVTTKDDSYEIKEYLADNRYYYLNDVDARLNSADDISESDAQDILDALFRYTKLSKTDISHYSEQNGYMVFTIKGKTAEKLTMELFEDLDEIVTLKVQEVILRAKIDKNGNLTEEQRTVKCGFSVNEVGIHGTTYYYIKSKATYFPTTNLDFSIPFWAKSMDS